ncbi:hypothetical protein BURMUCGD1_4751 [Burkholderia multivorans CGD1]|nr:hypothetical protein BURMUCGD1_4751 [Burkholderia multivorans CGD1]
MRVHGRPSGAARMTTPDASNEYLHDPGFARRMLHRTHA